MKYQGYIDIHQNRKIVVAAFMNPAYLKEYQDGFQKKEVISGNAGEEGCVSKMHYQYANREMVLTETIVKNQLPEYFEAFYHHEHMDNTMKVSFVEIDANTTRYNYEYEYTRLSWIMPKLIGILFPNVYRKQGEKWFQQFKTFTESL